MKKLIGLFSAFLLMLGVISGSAFADGIQVIADVTVQADKATKEVAVQGKHLNGSGQTVTVRVLDPDGSIAYIDQITTQANGSFSFKFKPKNPAVGNYSIALNANGNSSPYVIGFHYNKSVDNPEGRTGGGSNGNISIQNGTSGNTGTEVTDGSSAPKADIAFETKFVDIAGHWAKKDIELLAAKHVVNGMTDRTFEPDGVITRAQFAAMIVKAIGIQPQSGTKKAFSDVSSSEWFYEAVQAAAQAGIVNGINDKQFAPKDPISREQITVMIMRAYSYLTGQDYNAVTGSGELIFTDRDDIDSWAVKAVQTASDLGIVSGIRESVFAPGEHATRAQAAVLLKRLLEKTENI